MTIRPSSKVRLSRIRRTAAIFRLAISYWRDARALDRAKRRLSDSEFHRQEQAIYRAGGQRFREAALRLGGLIIKVGQFLSARTDVLPLAFTRELAALQDQVPAAPWDEVKALMEAMWEEPLDALFSQVEPEPLAAASLGQVHRAMLTDGEMVAIKVQRPGIDRVARIDLSALRVIMGWLERRTRVGRRLNAVRLLEEFETLVGEELDYRIEEAHQVRFAAQFANDARIRVPKPLTHLTRERVLVMEYVEGIKLNQPDAIRQAGLDGPQLAHLLIESYLKQIITDGFVQLDPHAGNFFADSEGRLIFLDFGMMGEIPPGDLAAVADLLRSVLGRDARGVVSAIDRLGFIRPGASPRLMMRAVQLMVDHLSGVPLKPGPEMDRAVAEFQDFLYQEPLQFPARYMFLGRAIGMLFGLISGLNPDLDWMHFLREKALPLLNARLAQDAPWINTLGGWAGQLLGADVGNVVEGAAAIGWTELRGLAALPGQARRVLQLMEDGTLATQPELTPLLRRVDWMGQLALALVRSLWSGLALALAWAINALWPHIPGIRPTGIILAVLAWISAAMAARRARSHLGRPRR
ncbi:ABC1 kinase family protein [Sulfobacillus harzensis]|uniref:AarF/ABC1/UbiB kinase family protein n=1 Tax=Sulfobacillus harzensis TaxID=2729629 RepID=A0A7Y0Q3U3_9FIRM|nr:AarF/UbiB family protein [Sulfobacillus harzensis]NMP23341.1 AarF/ABC1/UbiB kinase family protein [Sulfobacillus harzensis]